MYTPEHFAQLREDVMHDLIRAHPLATLISSSEAGLEASHLPVVFDAGTKSLRGHMARANSHWRTLDGARALAVFHGPQHYISPSWYPSKAEHGKVVPTWNYIAVHVSGTVRVSDDPAFLLRNVTDLTDSNEARFAQPWRVTDAPATYIEAVAKGIVGFELAIDRIEGKWKISQNRNDADQEAVIQNLEALATDASRDMAAAMRNRRA